jgi:hypothetical protein
MSVRIIKFELPKLLLTKALNGFNGEISMRDCREKTSQQRFEKVVHNHVSGSMSKSADNHPIMMQNHSCDRTIQQWTSNAKQDSKISSSALNQTEKQTIQASKFSTCNHSR